jgi:coenzyme F420-dependent glucose-6-phosphate dehydrogenase
MASIGYALSSEEHSPLDLVKWAKLAEESGFPYALISDHFHPWVSQQPHSPMVWNVLGGISQTTQKLRIGTGVTCPFQRIHPAIIAQAAATTAAMMPGRFFLGLGTGENLNEHILGDRWPPFPIRLEMLGESIELMKELWKGEMTTHYGEFFTVEDAKIFTLPQELPQIAIAAEGEKAATFAGEVGDALITTSPNKEAVQAFRDAGGKGKPCYGQLTVCWANSEEEAVKTAHHWWPNAAIPKPCSQELRSVDHFDKAAESVTPEQIKEKIICGPDVKKHLEAIREYVEAGLDHVYVHQVGPDQAGFMQFYQKHILPEFQGATQNGARR